MSELIIAGKKDFILGFYLTGLGRIYEIKKDADSIFRQLLDDPSAGIIVTDKESDAMLSPELKRRISLMQQPVIIVLSDDMAGSENIRQMIKRSIGIDLMRSDDNAG